MNSEELNTLLEETFGFMFEEELLKEIAASGTYQKLSHDEILMDQGDVMTDMPLILSGAVKILRDDEETVKELATRVICYSTALKNWINTSKG